jgi:hypothetical protein
MGKFSEGETLHGWGVVRSAPWHFVGLYADKATAEAAAKEAGPDYIVRLGDNQAGTDNFIWTNGDNPGATD